VPNILLKYGKFPFKITANIRFLFDNANKKKIKSNIFREIFGFFVILQL